MRGDLWKPEADCALAVGAGLGLSAAQIAKCMGPQFTRNMIIGRSNRIGVSCGGGVAQARQSLPKPPKISSSPNQRWWSPDEDAQLREMLAQRKTRHEISQVIGRSVEAIDNRRHSLGIEFRDFRRFTAEEDTTITALFKDHVPVEKIAVSINRTYGAIRQRINVLDLKRDGRKTSLAKRFGAEVLAISDDPSVIRATMLERERFVKETAENEHAAKVNLALDLMQDGLALGNDRKTEFQAAMLAGATLEQVSQRVGITRERVRQIVHSVGYSPRPPRLIICAGCSAEFTTSTQGGRKYCDACRVARMNIHPMPKSTPLGTTSFIEKIVTKVAEHFGYSALEIYSHRRSASLVEARHVAMYLVTRLTNHSYPEIGRAFDRDHTSIMYAAAKIVSSISSDAQLKASIRQLELDLSPQRTSENHRPALSGSLA